MKAKSPLQSAPDVRRRTAFFTLLAFGFAAGLAAVPAATLSVQPLRSGKWPAAPRFGGDAVDVKVVGNYAYVALYEGGLAVFEVSNPTNGVRVGGWQTSGSANAVAVSGRYAYLAQNGYFGGALQVIDVSNPTNCVRMGGIATTNGRATGVAVVGSFAYVAADAAGLEVFDVSNPTNCVRVGGCYIPGGQAFEVAVSGNYAYLADGGVGLQVIDVSNPTNCARVGGFDTFGGYAVGVAVSGNYAYLADADAGLHVINVSNPAHCVRVGGVDTGGSALGVTVLGNHAYVADGSAGLQVIEVSNPTNCASLGSFDTSGGARRVAVSGQRLSWEWDDGTTNDNWFPAQHHYAANGSYTVRVMAFSTEGETHTETAIVTVTNANPAGCDHITLHLASPEYPGCGDVSVNGFVATTVGQVNRLVWDWGDGATNESWFPAQHRYASNGTYWVTVTAYSSAGEIHMENTSVHLTALVPACDNTFRVYPPIIVLKGGKTNEMLRLDLRDRNGQPLPFDLSAATFNNSRPDLVQVDESGQVSATGLGEARIEVRIAGQPQKAVVQVVAGEILIEPAILLLSLEPATPGQVTVLAFNADGSPVNLAGRQTVFSGGNAVASVDAQGSVQPLQPPAQFWESPYITATLDGMPARNACFVRVTQPGLGLPLNSHAGEFTSFTVADNVGPHPYGLLMTQLQVAPVMDAVFRLERRLSGAQPHQGGRQFFVMDPGFDNDGTVPCGLSGNPIRLGVGVDNLRSCLGGTDWLHWGVMGHELAHNFLYHASFGDFLSGLNNPGAYSEGLATALSVYSFEEILANPQLYGITPATTNSLAADWLHLMPNNVRQYHFAALTNYEADPQYSTQFDANLADAILLKLGDDYGPGFFFRFLSVFYPPEEIFLSYANETQRLTFWVAACSAAAQADLRTRFSAAWGYPMDDDFYERILPLAKRRAAQRDPLIRSACVESNCLRLVFNVIPDTAYTVQCSSNLTDWTSMATNTAASFTCEAADPMVPIGQRFYRVQQRR